MCAVLALLGCVSGQRAGRRQQQQQRPREGRQGTGYAAPAADNSYSAPADAQPAYGADQDVYQVYLHTAIEHLHHHRELCYLHRHRTLCYLHRHRILCYLLP